MIVNTDIIYRNKDSIDLWCSKCDGNINVPKESLVSVSVEYAAEDFTDYSVNVLVTQSGCSHVFEGCDEVLISRMKLEEFR